MGLQRGTGIKPKSPALGGRFFTAEPQGKPISGQRKNQGKRLRRSELRGVPIANNVSGAREKFRERSPG